MSEFLETLMLFADDVGGDVDGPLINTALFPSIDKNLRPQPGKQSLKGHSAMFTIDAVTVTGTSMACDVVAVIDGVDHIVGVFTDLLNGAPVNETIIINFCPDFVKIVLTEDTITTFNAKFYCTRF